MNDAKRVLRALTWNIHGCVGVDGQHNVDRIGACIRFLQPHIAAFQEVDTRRKSAAQVDVLGFLRAQVGEHGYEAWSMSGADGDYGQMLASQFPLHDRRVHDISVEGREPRRAMEAVIEAPNGSLRVIATHLGLRRSERTGQIRRLNRMAARDRRLPLILLGDLNEWHGRRLKCTMPEFCGWKRPHRTFPSHFPLLALDRILCRPPSILIQSRTVKIARLASDHLPVIADIALPEGAPA